MLQWRGISVEQALGGDGSPYSFYLFMFYLLCFKAFQAFDS